MTLEMGKPIAESKTEVSYAAEFFRWFSEEAVRVSGRYQAATTGKGRLLVIKQPVGPAYLITPWNFPAAMATRKIGPAIAAGCTMVLKPAEQTPLCAVAVFEILAEAGLPAGVANLVTTGRPAEVGEPLVTSPAVRKLTFTGSTQVGKLLAGQAAGDMKRLSMELGGHAPFVVFDDADPVHAAKGAALVKFLNTGQACICPNRIYVHRSIMDPFAAALVDRVKRLKIGRGDGGCDIGPLVDEAALAKVQRQVADATAKGARLLVGGERVLDEGLAQGQFFAPTVLADVDSTMTIYREETFGPVAALIPFDDEAEAIELANDTEYGLASYVYTKDLARALRFAEALQFGIVGVNDINPTAAAAPFGGVGVSGLGREGGAQGIDEYLDVKLVGISI